MNHVRGISDAQKKKSKKNTKEEQLVKVPEKLSEEQTEKLQEKTEKPLQWHPAFFAEMQIELSEEAENLIFENEHQLGTKPKEIDILVIKKNADIPVKKNIGRIFRKYNIIEYKSPEDSLTINDFYKVVGYTYFYKADTKQQDEIRMEELTVTFVSRRFPQGVFRHLESRGMKLVKVEAGIWYMNYDSIDMQFIVTAQLSEKKNFWMKNLTNDLQDKRTADRLLEDYRKHKADIHYSSVMDVIMRANKKIFSKEDKEMCQAMIEIFKENEHMWQTMIEIFKEDKEMCRAMIEIFRENEYMRQKMMESFKNQIDEMVDKSREDGIRIGERNGEEKGILLTKQVLRLHADGADYETIALKCMLTVDEVKDILSY